nr:ImcF-related family protein [Pseudomonas fluorescens]
MRVLLLVGERTQVEDIAPGLTERKWLAGHTEVLVYGGDPQSDADDGLLLHWQQALCRGRGLDSVIWALSRAQSQDAVWMSKGLHCLNGVAQRMHWRLPLHLWEVCDSHWPRPARETQPVGCYLAPHFTPPQFEQQLTALIQPLRQQGLEQMRSDISHDFLLRLSSDLQDAGITRWRQALSALFGKPGVMLRGLWFSQPVPRPANAEGDHHWPRDPAWQGLLDDKPGKPRRLGWSTTRVSYAVVLGLVAICGAGMLLSFASNRAQVAQVQTSLDAVRQSSNAGEQLDALREMVHALSRLAYRADHGAPWYQRFGLNQNAALRDVLWPEYIAANNALLRDPAAARLEKALKALVGLPAGSPGRARRAADAYNLLKAYLMLARPENADTDFLVKTLGADEPSLWQFYAEHLPTHPGWRIDAHPALVAQVRQVLLADLGQRNGESTLYQQALDTAANHYPAVHLQQMVGETDASPLFSTNASVPGAFTRQAWDGQVRDAIDAVAKARREEIDWVLSDNPSDIARELSPETLKERLTARYFEDYSSAWLAFLNSLRWRPSQSLPEVIEQLTLMSDVRQSPLIALMNTLAYQGQAGVRAQALSDSLLQSARDLVAKDKTTAQLIEHVPQGQTRPLDATFGPLLALMGKDAEGKAARGDQNLSLQIFLTRVTAVRLKLQEVSNATDPLAMTQALAQTVFQGKRVDLTDTQSYGSLIAASLGADWSAAAQTLFVQPLDQAWQRVLQPSAASLNGQWQRAIVDPWQGAFAGRYPFAATTSDASLPMLGQMIRADSGRIEQFLRHQLTGLLRKEGVRWVADPRHGQGLRFNPKFIEAINELSQLADVLFTDGGMGLSFELEGRAVRDIVQTTFILNGQKLHYFNQRPSWQRFSWPGIGDYPGTSLTWTSVYTGERLFGDYQGTWGLIRLLEQGRVTVQDDGDSRFLLQIDAADGLALSWNMRTELGEGPMALLRLRGFTLPREIFVTEGESPAQYAQAEARQ